VREGVNSAGNAVVNMEDVKTQDFSQEKRSRRINVKLLELCISENSGLAAFCPASTVQQKKRAE
jgi:hypothetical protein